MAKLNREEFVLEAIRKLRSEKQKGLCTGLTGLEGAFKNQYGEKADLVKTCSKMQTDGRLIMRSKGDTGHYMIYLPEEAPAQRSRTASDVLTAMSIKPRRVVQAS